MSGVTNFGERNVYADEVRRVNDHLQWLIGCDNPGWQEQGRMILRLMASNYSQGLKHYYELFPDRKPEWR